MIDDSCIRAYMKLYSDWEKTSIGYEEPGTLMFIEANGKSYVQPHDETTKSFMERLGRCTKEHNVFLEEWREDTTDYANIDL